MAVFVEDGITLTLKRGGTVTLVERAVSVAEREAIKKQALLLGYKIRYKEKRLKELDERTKEIEADANLNGNREEKLQEIAALAGDEIASLDEFALYADRLSRQFESWDVYATKADMDAGIPVELTKEAILAFCDKPARGRLIEDIVLALNDYEQREEKKDAAAPANSGVLSMTTPTVQ